MGNIMAENPRAVAIMGSYRRGGAIDSTVAEILGSLKAQGVEGQTVYLADCHIEFCTNCRSCLQAPGVARGKCPIEDDMEQILELIEAADYLILGAPTNAGNANALTRRFIERCVCFAYWPWGSRAPVIRNRGKPRRSILVSASGAPQLIGRYLTGTLKALRQLSEMLGARPVGTVWVGGVIEKEVRIPDRVKAQCRRLAHKLTAGA